MSKNTGIIIIGASGHGKEIADIILKSGDSIYGYLDDDKALGNEFNGFPILGVLSDFRKYMDYLFVIGIGNALIRERVADNMLEATWYTAIDPNAIVSDNATIGSGSVVMPGAIINAGATIGKHCIINTGAIVEHDNKIDDYVHVSVGACLAGTVHIGKRSWIGVGSAVSNNISICDDCMIGAGAVVVKDISEAGTYVGVPAYKIKA